MNFVKDKKGFTLAELLVVMAITVILIGIAFVSLRESGARSELKQSILEFSENLRKIQNYSMTGQVTDGAVPNGYGLYIDSVNTYVFFQDLNANNAWDTGETIMSYELKNNTEFVFSSFSPEVCDATNGCVIISRVPQSTFCYDNDNGTKDDVDCTADNVQIEFSNDTLTDTLILNTYSGKVSY